MRFVCHTKCVDSKGARYRVGQEADWERDDPFTKWWTPLDEAPVGEEPEGVHEPQTLYELQAAMAAPPPVMEEEAAPEPKPVKPKAPPKKPVRRGRR